MTTPTLTGQTLGLKLRGSRVLAGLDQQQMADALHVGRTTVSGWERDKFEPTASSLFLWAQMTGQSLDWFAEGITVRPERLELPTFWMVAVRLVIGLAACQAYLDAEIPTRAEVAR